MPFPPAIDIGQGNTIKLVKLRQPRIGMASGESTPALPMGERASVFSGTLLMAMGYQDRVRETSRMPDPTQSDSLQSGRSIIRERATKHPTANPRVFGVALKGEDRVGGELNILVGPLLQTTLFDLGGLKGH
jgi:hypothetical protein